MNPMKMLDWMSGIVKCTAVALVGVCSFSAFADLYVTENGVDTNPGTSAAPFRSVQAAVDAAPDEGCKIHVAAGTYYAKASVAAPNPVLSVKKPVQILGAGAGVTFISGADLARYCTEVDCEGALLKDVTLCHAKYSAWVTGVGLKLKKGEVRNVIIEDISGYHSPGAEVSGGALYDSVIRRISTGTTPENIGLRLSGGLVSGCEIYGLSKVGNGSMTGAGVRQTGGTLENCYIHDNWYGNITYASHQSGERSGFANSSGVGLWMSAGLATGCRIARNGCIGHAAGAKVTGTAVLENSTIVDNVSSNIYVASEGGGVSVDGTKAVVRGCVIANNRAFRGAGGLALLSGTVTNNVIYANGISNCCVKAGTFADNVFVNPGISDTETYTRPAADAFSCSFTTDRDFIRGNSGGTVAFTASAKNAPGEVTYAWSFSDGGSASGVSASHSFGVGRHTVTLTATAGGQTAVCKTKDAITVYPQKVYVSKSGTPKFPYTSTDDAASEIDDVMDLFPLEIEVGAGTYGLRNKGLFFCHAVRVKGAGPDVTIVDGKNTSYTRGLVLDHPDAVVSGLQFYRNNLCTWDSGAGVQLFNGTVSNCWVRKASGYNNIGVNLSGGRLVDSLVTESVNYSSQMGLAVSLRGGSMYGCVVSNNTTTGTMNGIVYVNNAASVVSNCTICCNQAGSATAGSSKGGAVSMTAGLVTNCRLLNNKSGVTGGGAYLTGGTLRNCLVEGNSTLLTAGSNGGGVYNDGGAVENCTVVGNTATGSGDGLYQNKGSTVNSIVWQNMADNLVAPGGTVTYSCMSPVVTGDGNTAMAPAFVSAATGNWRLTSLASAQIDHGTKLDWMTDGALDLDGKARVVRDVPDMGCYEYAPSADEPFIAQFTATGASGKAPINASFEAVVSKHPASECTFSWYFGDSETPVVVVGSATTSHLYETAGSYTVRLVVSHGSEQTAPFETPACVNVIPKTCYVSTIGGNVFPYDTLAKAARDVMAAYAVNSDEIVVSNGTYESATISLGRSVTVRSLNGLGTVTLTPTAAAKGSPFVNVSAEGAVLSGIAVSGGETSGYGESLGGSGVHMTAGLVTNCIVRGCRQYACGGVFVSGTGHFVDCVVSNNDSWANGGYAGGLYQRDAESLVAGCRIVGNYCSCVDANTDGGAGAVIAGGTMRDCIFTRNIGNRQNSKGALTVTGGLVSHCVITNNELYSYAGGVWQKGGTVRNCLIADNVTVGARDNDGAGGLLLDAGTAESLTIVANRSERPGGGVRQNGGTLLNSVVYGNTSPVPECDMLGGTRANCLSEPAMVGTDCLGGDPLFENAAAGDYRLSVLSPAKGAGLNQDWMTDAVDLANFMRISGDRVDIGAYEVDATAVVPLSVAFAASVSVRLSDGTTRITFTPTVGGAKGAVTLTWDFGDGTTETEAPYGAIDHVYQPGAYTVKVKASDAGSGETTDWTVRADYAVALPKVCYVATGAGVTPRYPYVTPETGAATLNDALVAGTEEICVMPGTYQMNETLNIGRAVKIYSHSGKADDVVVTGKTADNFLMVSMNDPAAELRGITLSGGYMHNIDADLGATVKLYSGLIIDCILENGHTYCNGAVSMNGGTIRRSVIRGHRNISSGVCNGLQINAGLVDGCIITNNAHAGNLGSTITPAAVYVNGANARIRNSLIAYNKGYYGAGLLLGNSAAGEVVNCTIVSNVATHANGGVKGGSLAPLVCANNIVWGNVAPVNPEMSDDIVTFFSYSCSPALTRGTRNISADPAFRNISRGDWRLGRNSPCVESGDWSVLGASKAVVRAQVDMKGAARLSGAQVDMGCYENPLNGLLLFVK